MKESEIKQFRRSRKWREVGAAAVIHHFSDKNFTFAINLLAALISSLIFFYYSSRFIYNTNISLTPRTITASELDIKPWFLVSTTSWARVTRTRMWIIDSCSAFNAIVCAKLYAVVLDTHLYSWLLDFLTGRTQEVKINNSVLTLNTGTPQGCVLSPLLYSLFDAW